MKQSTIKYNNLIAYNKVNRYIRSKGKDYAKANYFRPEVIRKDFDLWNEITGREKVYISAERMERYISNLVRHYLVTEPRFNEFKKAHGLGNKDFAEKLGYSSVGSFHRSAFRWMRLEKLMDTHQEMMQFA